MAAEAVLHTSLPPAEAAEFGEGEFPAIIQVEEDLFIAQGPGYHVAEHFPLEQEGCRWEQYYQPLGRRTSPLHRKGARDTTAQEVCDTLHAEIPMFEHRGSSYGYEFLVLQRT